MEAKQDDWSGLLLITVRLLTTLIYCSLPREVRKYYSTTSTATSVDSWPKALPSDVFIQARKYFQETIPTCSLGSDHPVVQHQNNRYFQERIPTCSTGPNHPVVPHEHGHTIEVWVQKNNQSHENKKKEKREQNVAWLWKTSRLLQCTRRHHVDKVSSNRAV